MTFQVCLECTPRRCWSALRRRRSCSPQSRAGQRAAAARRQARPRAGPAARPASRRRRACPAQGCQVKDAVGSNPGAAAEQAALARLSYSAEACCDLLGATGACKPARRPATRARAHHPPGTNCRLHTRYERPVLQGMPQRHPASTSGRAAAPAHLHLLPAALRRALARRCGLGRLVVLALRAHGRVERRDTACL